ncbi:ABC transporter substrate-binding protein [Aequorivita sp. 609]|uniref:ABC transporter substrate-binding protein n=1 Tax=Aequorivita TaxID=153265 RepID=UPI00161325A0|nr:MULTISPECIES: helical backbone metal receptor [Aequorivita]MBB6680792.1 ABC transporter substrate-binding protein [Aequorivita sp. 609]
MEFIDQLNRVVKFSKTPTRIVSLVPSQTELLVDLGLRDNIVGVTKFCVHPNKLRKEKTIVGGTKNVHFEKVKALNPDIVICNKEENTEEIVIELEKIAPVWVSDISNISECIEMINRLGEVFEVSQSALEISSKILSQLKAFRAFSEKLPIKKVVYLIWKDPYMAAGRDTFINELLELNRFENLFTDENSRYPEVREELLRQADTILLSTEPFPFKQKHVSEFQKEFKAEVKLVDGEFFSWYGSRMTKAFEYFKRLHES